MQETMLKKHRMFLLQTGIILVYSKVCYPTISGLFVPLFTSSLSSYGTDPGHLDNQSSGPSYMKKTVKMVVRMVEMVMESSTMRLAMVVSGIVFTQRSILNYIYFLNTINRLLAAAGLG